MNSPCEVLVDGDQKTASMVGKIAEQEARRIESKFSRYRSDSMLSNVNASNGKPVTVDAEMIGLLTYAEKCFQLSDGLFDITSGVLRRVWRFEGSDIIPSQDDINLCIPFIGFHKIIIDVKRSTVTLPKGVEIDFGGIAKEFAVDRALRLAKQICSSPMLINFGGDLAISGPRRSGAPWMVAIDSINDTEGGALALSLGAVTTSGDAARYVINNGVRYSHILNPKTGWPIKHSPRSVTVAAPSCMAAGMMSTLAMLKGADAEKFIHDEGLEAWVIR
jgi:thiamine biosynthesis lipoprotein